MFLSWNEQVCHVGEPLSVRVLSRSVVEHTSLLPVAPSRSVARDCARFAVGASTATCRGPAC